MVPVSRPATASGRHVPSFPTATLAEFQAIRPGIARDGSSTRDGPQSRVTGATGLQRATTPQDMTAFYESSSGDSKAEPPRGRTRYRSEIPPRPRGRSEEADRRRRTGPRSEGTSRERMGAQQSSATHDTTFRSRSVGDGRSSAAAMSMLPTIPRAQSQVRTGRGALGSSTGLSGPPTRRPSPSVGLRAHSTPSRSPPRNGIKMGVGLEIEFLLKALYEQSSSDDFPEFCEIMSHNHNREVPPPHPQMKSAVVELSATADHSKWTLQEDPTRATRQEPCESFRIHKSFLHSKPMIAEQPLGGIEISSPHFQAYPGSKWRDRVKRTWRYVVDTYDISTNVECSSHVHISVKGGYSLRDIKRVAQSVIHFEPAFEALLPPHRRANHYTKSNWLDAPALARKGLSRPQSMAFIDTIGSLEDLPRVLQPREDKFFGWNFHSLEKYGGTIEFHRGAASMSADEIFGWAEPAMTFIQMALRHGLPAQLQNVPATLGELHRFLGLESVPRMNERHRIDFFFHQRNMTDTREPRPAGNVTPAMRAKLEKKKEKDRKKILMLKQGAQARYF
jgi:Putative amidoligase enzyme